MEDRQSRLAQLTVNEGNERKSTSKAKLKACSQEERLQINLLRKLLTIKILNLESLRGNNLTSTEKIKTENRKTADIRKISSDVLKTRKFDDFLNLLCNAVNKENAIEK